MKKIAQVAMAGVRIAAVVFLIYCIVFGLIGGEEKFASGYGIARAGLGAVIIGIGFGIPSVVYETKLKMWLKMLIHMGIGCTVMIGASLYAIGCRRRRHACNSGSCCDSGRLCICNLDHSFYPDDDSSKEDESKNQGEAAGRITATTKHYSSRAQSTKIGCAFSLPAPYREERRRAASEATK